MADYIFLASAVLTGSHHSASVMTDIENDNCSVNRCGLSSKLGFSVDFCKCIILFALTCLGYVVSIIHSQSHNWQVVKAK